MTMLAGTCRGSGPDRRAETQLERRALALWPRLGRRALRRCRSDPTRIAELVSRRTSLEVDAILRVLIAPAISDDEAATWFG